MKPDDFDDSIRRKLDGIEPPFREKDWTQMQQVMRQHGMITPWSAAPSWLMPAAGVVSVAALLTTTVWLGQTNQQLRQDVHQLKQTVTQLKQVPPAVAPRTDTVYVTRLVPTPTDIQTNRQAIEPNFSVPQPTPTRDNAVAIQPQVDTLSHQPDRDPSADRSTVAGAPSDRIGAPANRINQPITSTGESARSRQAPERPAGGTAPADASGNRVTRTVGTRRDRTQTNANRSAPERPMVGSERVETVASSGTSGQTGRAASSDNRAVTPSGRVRPNPTRSRPTGSDATGAPDGPTETAAPVAIERIAAKPMRLDSTYVEEGISRAVRRLRRLYPAKALPVLPVSPTTAPEATAVVTPNDHFRLGVTAELGLKQWSLGIYGDVLLGRHFLVGLGLERVSISGGEFSSDIIFEKRIRRSFRGYYAPGIDNRHLVLNISRRSVTWQVPVTLGYRIPVGTGIALTPAVGVSTSLSAYERVAFAYADPNRKGPFELQEVQLPTVRRPVNWYHSWSASVGVEKRWGPLTVQASPYLVGPFTNSPLGLNGTSGGLRLRTLYSF